MWRWFLLLVLLLLVGQGLLSCAEDDDDCVSMCGDDDASPPDDDTGDDDQTPEDCTACHATQAEAWENFSSHQALYDCDFCHEEISDEPGPNHRTRPGCDSCHSEQTHVPTYFPDDGFRLISCLTCHDPHGSPNIYLVQPEILVAPGHSVPIDFQNQEGLAAGSYAQPGAHAGTGLCEVCHTATAYYNRFGNGQPHYTGRCSNCHGHDLGFANP